ncbi:hypothetical protein BHE74_00029439 [Ensete ventricosum]|uniref:Uncharacterized protein n=1 Tax=Ensete ventricosum TaxID=4639 RepID=A0A426XIH7_ENSVE|nr:hypothetical protein B296_00048011 [Ensete ventricosum]RWW63385.1 hypothetical protein BHE74_00029439 [Ensete ventricosum]
MKRAQRIDNKKKEQIGGGAELQALTGGIWACRANAAVIVLVVGRGRSAVAGTVNPTPPPPIPASLWRAKPGGETPA